MANLTQTLVRTISHALHGERYNPTPEASAETIHKASKSFVAIVTNDDQGIGSGVAISPNTILTVAHNFNNCSFKGATIFVPGIKTGVKIQEGLLFQDIDLAVITTSSDMRVTPVKIDVESELSPGVSVFSHSTIQAHGDNFERIYLTKEFSLTHRNGDYSFQGVTLNSPSDIFRLKTVKGDSGAGIFTANGKLLSLVKTSGGILTTTTGAIHHKNFRNRLEELGII